MIMNDKFLSFLGITRKSGNLYLCMDCVKDNIVKKNISLILTTSDISEKSLEKIRKIAIENKVELKKINYTMQDIESSVKKAAGIIGISSENFVNKINSLISESNNEQEDSIYDN